MKCVVRVLAIIFIASALTGCISVPKPTREQWLDMTSHTFKSTTVDDVLKSGDKVLNLDDPDDVTIYHQQDRVVGSRKYLLYMVFAAAFGNYNFDLSAKQQGDDVVAQLMIGHSTQPVIPTVTYTPGTNSSGIGAGASTGISIGSPIPWRESYDLFFSRVESLLHKTIWVTCEEAKIDKSSVAYESMCLMADDNIPEGAKRSEVSKISDGKMHVKRIPFPLDEYKTLPVKGSATIRGQAFIKTKGGDLKFAGGKEVLLNPVTSYSLQWWETAYLNNKLMEDPDSKIYDYIKKQIADGSGKFEFNKVPAGEYIIATKVTWQTSPGDSGSMVRQGGHVAKRIVVKDGDEIDVVLTR